MSVWPAPALGGTPRSGVPAPVARRAQAAPAAPAAPLGGVNVAAAEGGLPLSLADREIARARALHARVVRTEVSWAALEPRAAGAIEPQALAFLDRLVGDAAASGIKVIVTADFTPCWASSAPRTLLSRCRPGDPSRANAWPPGNPSAYAAFVAYLAARYGTRLAAIEVWNEPDQANEDYLAGPAKPQHYAALLRAAYTAIKQANPAVPVLAGSLVGSNGTFLRALYAAGIKGYYDGLAVHFYNLTLGSLRALHEVQLANGDRTPLWLDEFGWSSCWPRQRIEQEQACVTPAVQAKDIVNLYRSLARTPWVAAQVLYKLQDSAGEAFGVLGAKGARKPAFAALAGVLANPLGSPSRVTLKLRRRGGRVVASGEGPVGDYMQLEVLRGGALRYRALFSLNRFNRYSIPLPAALGTRGLTVRVFQYWQGRGRDARRSI
ncbi:MAG TPA: cellulase family glycosylhydrolase [Solirubrobacteraceae bacterium]|nr:cellulase family glycosylhydrolase [Solirubrobacteraceae bacterium]